MLKWILLFVGIGIANVDLVAPFTVDLKGSGPIWDTLDIKVYLNNIGTTGTPPLSYDAISMHLGIDSVLVAYRTFPIGYVLNAGYFHEYDFTSIVLKGPFSVYTWADPIFQFGQTGTELTNNVRSQAYNFHPKIIRDTILLIDTLRIHDTVKVAIHDTVKITLRDTVIKKDTIKYCPPSLTKTSGRFLKPLVATTVFNAIGQPEWTGMVLEGEFPQVRLKQGLHLLIQGQQVRRFQVAYK